MATASAADDVLKGGFVQGEMRSKQSEEHVEFCSAKVVVPESERSLHPWKGPPDGGVKLGAVPISRGQGKPRPRRQSRSIYGAELRHEKEDCEGCGDYYEVENVICKKKFGRSWKYLVSWKGWSKVHNSWEPYENVCNLTDLLEAAPEYLGGYYEAENIICKRKIGQSWKYLVSWKGWSADFNSWEPYKNVRHLTDLVEAAPVIT